MSRYTIRGMDTGDWQDLSKGTTIGYARLDRLAQPLTVRHIHVQIDEAVGTPDAIKINVFAP